MSIWSHLLDSEWRQRHDIDTLKRRAAGRRKSIMRRGQARQAMEARIEGLENEVAELQLLTRTLISTLRDSDAWDEDRFGTRLHDLDLEDGELDGK